MTENTEVVPAQEQPTTPETPAPTPEAAPTEPVSEAPAAVTQEPAAVEPSQETPAPKTPIKVTVSSTPPKKKEKSEFVNRKEWIAKRRAENQEMLKNAGYKPDAIVEILRFMSLADDKYPYAKGLKSPLVHMLAAIATGIHYQTATWGSGDVSQLICLLVEVNGIFASKDCMVGEKKFMAAPGEEVMKFVRETFDSVWTKSKVMCNQNLARAKAAILRAINSPKHPESIAARARYVLECFIEITMNMVDPFEGIFHDQVIPVPEELKGKVVSYEELKNRRQQIRNGHKPQNNQRPPREPQLCKKCGKELTWVREIHRNICTNVMCVWGTTKEEAIERWGGEERPQKFSKGGDHKGSQFKYKGDDKRMSAKDKFNAKYGKMAPKKPKNYSVVPTVEEIKPDGKKVTKKLNFNDSSSVWSALEGLKLGSEPAKPETPAEVAPAPEPAPEAPAAEAPAPETV